MVVTIGTFDGIHLGHQFMIKKLVDRAKELSMKSAVIFFEPQPKEFFMGTQSPSRLTSVRDKLSLFKSMGLDYVALIKFDTNIQSLSAEQFIKNILVDSMAVKDLIVGDDFKFGSDRKGNFQLLKYFGNTYSFAVENTQTYQVNGVRVSSTLIRELIKANSIENVDLYLGKKYFISGRIHHGDKVGRKIGFPTANMRIPKNIAVSGVYVVNTTISKKLYFGIANVGSRPTVSGQKFLLEVHLYDFSGDLYGQHLTISFLKHVRDEEKFNSFEELSNQIQKDKEFGYSWVKKYTNRL